MLAILEFFMRLGKGVAALHPSSWVVFGQGAGGCPSGRHCMAERFAGLAAIGLFIYLIYALLKPERF